MDQLAGMLLLLDPAAIAIVAGGAVIAAMLRGGRGSAAQAFAALGALRRADPEREAMAAMVAVGRVEALAEAKGITCADHISTAARFLREAVRQLSDARSADAFARWAGETIAARRRRHCRAIAFWSDLADAAPAMGMLATVIGLIRMFAAMTDPTKIGAPMATALVATLWGIVLANLLAGPIAERLQRLSDAEIAWQTRTLDHFTAIARAELDRPVARTAPTLAA